MDIGTTAAAFSLIVFAALVFYGVGKCTESAKSPAQKPPDVEAPL